MIMVNHNAGEKAKAFNKLTFYLHSQLCQGYWGRSQGAWYLPHNAGHQCVGIYPAYLSWLVQQ